MEAFLAAVTLLILMGKRPKIGGDTPDPDTGTPDPGTPASYTYKIEVRFGGFAASHPLAAGPYAKTKHLDNLYRFLFSVTSNYNESGLRQVSKIVANPLMFLGGALTAHSYCSFQITSRYSDPRQAWEATKLGTEFRAASEERLEYEGVGFRLGYVDAVNVKA